MYSQDMMALESKVKAEERRFGAEHPQMIESLRQLAHLYFIFGRLSDAERVLWRAVAVSSKCFGQEDLSVAELLIELGYLFESHDRYVDAEHVYRLAYAVRTIRLGKVHPDSMQAARFVSKVMRAQGKVPGEAELARLAKVAG
jgi:hypothetical protein